MKQVKTTLMKLAVSMAFLATTANAELPQLDSAKRYYKQPGVGTQLDSSRFRPQLRSRCPDGWRVQSSNGSDFTCEPIKPRFNCPEGTNYYENGCTFGCSSLI